MGFRGFMLATVCLLFALRTVPSMQERIIHENDGFKDLSAWTVKAGSWSTNWLSPEGSGLNLILLSKPVRGDWVMNLTLDSFYASPPLQIIVWWRDADNWLGFSAEKGQMKWVGMINGIRSAFRQAASHSALIPRSRLPGAEAPSLLWWMWSTVIRIIMQQPVATASWVSGVKVMGGPVSDTSN